MADIWKISHRLNSACAPLAVEQQKPASPSGERAYSWMKRIPARIASGLAFTVSSPTLSMSCVASL